MQYKSIIEKFESFLAVAYLSMSDNWLLWYKNVRCFILSSPWITDDMSFYIFTFACWTTVKYYLKVINTKKWMAGIHYDVSNKMLLIFLGSSICWYIHSIEHKQVNKYLWIIIRYRQAISLLYIVFFLLLSI